MVLLGITLVLGVVNAACLFLIAFRAFQKSPLWGVSVLCAPFVVFVFLVYEWDKNHRVGKIYIVAQITFLFLGGALEYSLDGAENEMYAEQFEAAVYEEFPEQDLANMAALTEAAPTPASDHAFDLLPADGRAVLVWAEASADGGRILARPVGERREVVLVGFRREAPAIEVLDVATNIDGRLTAVWSEQEPGGLVVRSGTGAVDERLDSVFSLGHMAVQASDPERRVYVAYDGTTALSLASGVPVQCGRRQCPGAQVRRLGAAQGTTVGESGLGDSESVSGFWRAGGEVNLLGSEDHRGGRRWFTRGMGRRAAEERLPVLDGCARGSISRVGQAHIASAQCSDARTVVALPDGPSWGQPRSVTCAEQKPTVHFSDGPDLTFEAPMADAHQVLPVDVADFGSIAVYTGSALVIATPTEGPLRIERASCEGGELVRQQVE